MFWNRSSLQRRGEQGSGQVWKFDLDLSLTSFDWVMESDGKKITAAGKEAISLCCRTLFNFR